MSTVIAFCGSPQPCPAGGDPARREAADHQRPRDRGRAGLPSTAMMPSAGWSCWSPTAPCGILQIKKEEGLDLGLNFDTYLMDEMRCANHCVFCFVDQMPPGMRQTLYFKDDDARLSFLQGNYITLTNLTEREAQRIIDLRIQPHQRLRPHHGPPQLHCTMLGNKNAVRSLEYMRRFCEAGIVMNWQIVICPGWNDGDQLRRTLRDLTEMEFSSCSLVPVGITKYRRALPSFAPRGRRHRRRDHRHRRRIRPGESGALRHPALFLRRRAVPAGGPPPAGGGLLLRLPPAGKRRGDAALAGDDFSGSAGYGGCTGGISSFTIATGTAAAPLPDGTGAAGNRPFPDLRGEVVAIDNDFFGHTIDVAGLLTGQDISRPAAKAAAGETGC